VTLRGRLTTAFLVVVLGPVLLGSIFVALTVATVRRDRTAERLDHAATTVRTAIGATCRQLQMAADTVAVVPADDRSAVVSQLVARGLATDISFGSAEPARNQPGESQAAETPSGGQSAKTPSGGQAAKTPSGGQAAEGPKDGQAAEGPKDGQAAEGPRDGQAADSPSGGQAAESRTDSQQAGEIAGWQDCASPAGGPISAIAATAVTGDRAVTAIQRVDAGFLDRLAAFSGARIALTDHAGPQTRLLRAGPGQPLPVTLTVRRTGSTFLYAVLVAVVLAAALAAVLVARWLARSTTRPLGDLAWAADRVANGDLNTRVPVLRPDELGLLATTFNRMTRELQAYVQALTASRDQLRGHLAILGETLSSTHDLHRILQVILRTALAATGARAGLVLLIDAAGEQLVAQSAVGLTGEWDVSDAELPTRRLPVGFGVLGSVAATGEPRRGHSEIGSAEPPCRTYVAVPICAPATVGDPLVPGDPPPSASPATLGVLALYDRVGGDAFDGADLHTLRTFAGQAGVAVHNVRVHEEAQRLSLTDPLTGLWNYRYLRESLRREVERASRFKRMLTVLVLDLDHFKEVNDTYGHAAGDTVLGEFARRIRIGLREVDVAFRQGGEEFVVLLPETDAYGGAIVAERLGAAVRDRPVAVDGRRAGLSDQISISVSIGIAVYPEHGATAQQVLDAADDALYAAKHSGRDTYRLADPTAVIQSRVSPSVPEGKFDPAASQSGGPQPPRQARGR
jgi:two-component system cell cycle response regulator